MAARGETLVVRGYRPFLQACAHAERDTRKYVREAFREVGEIVRVDAQSRFNRYSSVSAAGYRVRVRQTGVVVEQSLRKTTGRHAGWGAKQMKDALIPAVVSKKEEVDRACEHAIDLVADHFNRTDV